MVKTNEKGTDGRMTTSIRTAGGMGAPAAIQEPEALLRRAVLACVLFEDLYYESGKQNAESIANLVPLVKPEVVAELAIEARTKQKLRHVSLYLCVQMARSPKHRKLLGVTLPQVIKRADEPAEFLAMYFAGGKVPLAKQVKVGLGAALQNFDEYQLQKWDRNEKVKLRDVLFLVHGKPKDGQTVVEAPAVSKGKYTRGATQRHTDSVYTRLVEGTMKTADTWETNLSGGEDKKDTFTRLINERRLGGLAFLRNLRNMEEAGVELPTLNKGFENLSTQMLLPLNFLAAAKHAPKLERQIEDAMLKSFSNFPKLGGKTIFVIDVSGSMNMPVSERSEFDRVDAAAAMAMMASEVCEYIEVYATAGKGWAGYGRGETRENDHSTILIPSRRGFGLAAEIRKSPEEVGGGGIYTRQCLNWIEGQTNGVPDRIMVFSDSQDCDYSKVPAAPFGKHNYIIDVSSYTHGINYKGVWDAEISGWSEHFLEYVAVYEGLTLPDQVG